MELGWNFGGVPSARVAMCVHKAREQQRNRISQGVYINYINLFAFLFYFGQFVVNLYH